MPNPIDHPAAWCGDELLKRPDWRDELTDEEKIEAVTLGEGDSEAPIRELAPRLEQVQRDLENGSGACLVHGFPLDEMSPDAAEVAFETISRCIGSPVSQDAQGSLVFHVRDEGFQVGDPKARGPNTKKRLSFHTDRCDVIGFLCLRQAKSGGDNLIVSSMAVYNEMLRRRPDLVEVLMRPYYMRRHNVDTGNRRPWCQQPVFSFCDGRFGASYLRVLIDRAYELSELPDMSDQQREAVDYLEELAEDPALHVRFHQQPGDMLFLNNWVTLHRRDQFEDFQEPSQRRHLLRVWLAVPNSRPIDPMFVDNFGATGAGAIRGGMRSEV